MDPAAAKTPQIKTTEAPKNAGAVSKGAKSGPSARTLVPPEQSGRRPSLILGDANRKLRPGEVHDDKKGRRPSISAGALEDQINQESTPLKDIGEVGPPQIVDMYENYAGVEGEIGYISIQVQGIPAPTYKIYYKGVTPLMEGVRYKFHTDGETNTVTFCIRNVKASDEGKYKIIFTNSHGTVSDETQLYVSKPGCTDFRTLLRKSKYAKWGKDKGDPKWGALKGVQKAQDEFVTPLKDLIAKEGQDKKVEFMAKFSKPNAKPKWFYRQNELFMGVKHKFRNDGDTYYLSVLNPKLADSGKYMIDIVGVQSSAVLTVEAPDPSYKFIRPLNKKYDGFTQHELILECKVSDSIAIVSWYKGDKKFASDDKYFIDKDLQGVCTLRIKSCELNDTGDYRCQLERQPDKTETKVKVVEYPYKFLKCLKSQQNIEKDTVTLLCELDDPLGEVKWLKNGKEIKPDANVEIVKDGRKRKLVIKAAQLTDAGQYSCVSNADKTEADLTINKQNKFNKELKDTVAVERENLVLDIELEDDKAPAEWKFNGKPIKSSDRIEIKNLGGGKHQLVFKSLKLADAGEISVVSGKLSSSCKLTVQKGETKPQINAPKEVEGPVGKPLVLEVPFKIDGKKQTPVEASLIKDGKPLSAKDVEIQVKDDKVIFTFKKPTRDQSGPYQIKLSNGQGDDVKDIKITVQDVPKAPQDVIVREVFEKSCIIDWKTPTENGGTPLQKYIIEREDTSSKKGWENVGEVPADKPTTFKVEDLTPNKTYKFRIRAVNKVGPSEPAEFKNSVLAKNPWNPPSKPKSVEIVDFDNKSATIKWAKPENDGGAEIIEYEIEVKDKKSKDWVKKKRVKVTETTTTVEDLTEDVEYEFRVRAVNKAGSGEPSDATKLLLKPNKFKKALKDTVGVEREKLVLDIEVTDEKAPVEWKFNGKPIKPDDQIEIKNLGGGKHQLVFKNLKLADAGEISVVSGKLNSTCKLTVQNGESKPQINAPKEVEGSVSAPLVLEVPFKIDGKKQTSVEASLIKDGKPLSPKDVEIQVKDDKVIFTFKKPTRDQSGPYQIKLSNGQGDDVKDIKITVQDVPKAPQDVIVREVFEKSCVIDWKTPTENGGTPLQKYIIEREDTSSKKGWENVGEVPADKPTTFKVEDLTPNKTYKFRIRAVNKVGPSEPAEFKNSVLAKNPWNPPSKPKSVEIVDFDNKSATIKWAKPENDGGAEITEYEIEVKDKKSKDWVKKKRVKVTETTTTVEDLTEDVEYEFRVRAVNKAGSGEPSDATKLLLKPNKFKKALKDTVGVEREKLVLDIEVTDEKAPVEWKFNGKPIKPDDHIEIKNLGGGKHQLVFKSLKLVDAGEISVVSGKLTSTCKLTVQNGESKPQINAPKEVEGSVSAPLVLEVPFKIDGKKQTPIEASLIKDGKPLSTKDVEVQVKDDKVIFTIKKPTRDQSGPYQIKLSNGQGDDVKDINITVQDVPKAPQDVIVREVFEKSCVIDWKTPTENGGTPLQKYIIEREDTSSKKGWENVGEVPADKPTTFKVEDLTPNKTYKFRIRAVNKVGPSEPAEFKNSVLAKNPWDPPSKPKSIEVIDFDNKSATIKWAKPENDGGAEITEYEIEVKDKKSKDWVKKKRVKVTETTTTVEDLTEDVEYEFRVRAVNKAGSGEPSDATKLLLKPNKFKKALKDTAGVEREKLMLDIEVTDDKAPVEWKFNGKPIKPDDQIEIKNLGGGKHQLVFKNLKLADAGEISVVSGKLNSTCKLTVQNGETKPQINAPKEVEGSVSAPLVLEVPFKIDGKKQTPIEASLIKDGKPLSPKDVEVQVKDDKVIFTIKKPTRDQSGPYQIKLSNGQGDDVKDIKITVQDVPKAPQDVIVREVFEKSCIIDWKTPTENGGTPLQKYVIEREDTSSKKGWENVGEVPADKPTTFKVEDLTPNKTYKFRVRAVNNVGPSEPAEFKNSVLAKNPWDAPSKAKGVEVTDFDNKSATIKWAKPDNDGGAEITEYEIEVKDGKSKDWVKKKRVPASETSATVEDLKEGQEYEFRVRAVNKAGPGEPSDATKLLLKPNKFNKELKDTLGVEREKLVLDVEVTDEKAPVEWKFNGKPIKPDDQIEIKNLGGGKHQLVFKNLKLADAGEISVVSGKLNSTCKLTVQNGETKPQINSPKEVEGSVSAPLVLEVPFKIDGKKQTPIEALLIKDGKPLSPKDVEVQVKDDKVIFTIKKPTRDQSGPYQIKLSNGQGDDVKDIKITVQDVPKAPQDVIVREVFEKSCIIDWKTPTENGGTPLQKYIIEREDTSSKKGWENVGEVPADKPTTFKVEDLTPNKTYKFRVRAINNVGQSEPAEFKNSVLAKNPWDAPSKAKGVEVTDFDNKSATIKWAKPDNDGGAEITEYDIEVKDGKSKDWVKKKRVPASETSATVEDLKEGQEYEFRVRAVNKAGPGEPSDAIKLLLKPNKFNKELKDTVGVEREKLVLDIEVTDEKAPVEWKFNGKPIKPDDQFEVKNLGGGKHQLVFKSLKLADAGEVSVVSGKLNSTCKLTVQNGETKPQINAPKEVEGSVSAPLVLEVPFKIDGKKQTPIEASLIKDGKPLSPKDVEVQVKDDKVIFTIKKPTRDQSGPFQIKLSNGQGDDVKDIKITVQDVPKAPQDVTVREVFEKSCIIDWKTPTENGGTPLQKYIIEREDTSSKKGWENVGEVPADKPTTFKVEDLTPNKTYKFRVRAINNVGPSEPAEYKNSVLAKNPWDAPSKPKGIEVKDFDDKSANIKWAKPDKDGGAEITEYEIEVKEGSSKDWVKKKRVPASETSTTIEDLKEGQKYEFRVRAVNKAGSGEPSDATKSIVAKKPPVKPFISGDQLKKIVIKKGEEFKYQIQYGGEPEPEVKWQKDTKVLKADGDRIKIEKQGGITILTVRNSVRSDSGKYKLLLTNSSGTFESVGEVIVLDKPSGPKGPLKVSDVHEFGCKLTWNRSDDDGGVAIKQYKIEKIDSESNEWSLVTNVSSETTEYTVTGLRAGSYKFRVTAINDEGASESLTTENWTITKKVIEKTLVDATDGSGMVATRVTERKDISGDKELTTNTTVTTTTSKNQIQEGNRVITQTRTVKRVVTRTTEEETYEVSESEDEEEVEC